MDKNECLAKLEEERDHSAWLEKLLRVLYGDGWNKLTISNAQEWHTKHIASQPNVQDGTAGFGGCLSKDACNHAFCFIRECNDYIPPST